MKGEGHIALFWWSEIHFAHKTLENYGDLASKYIAEKISGKKVVWVNPKKRPLRYIFKKIILGAGSILQQATKNCVVWGSGIIRKDQVVAPATFLAVRGPQTRQQLLKQGHQVPEVYGDPALLLSRLYHPTIEKRYKVGIIPHYVDYAKVTEWFSGNAEVTVIDLMTDDVEKTTEEIMACEATISSSLHGVIVSHAYQIPSVQVTFSDKIFGDGIKYQDYFESVALEPYAPVQISEQQPTEALTEMIRTHSSNLPKSEKITYLQDGLMAVCPFVA